MIDDWKKYHNAIDTVCYHDSWCACDVRACRVIFMHMKEGADESRWEGEDDIVILYIYFEERGQRELKGVKTEYDIMCC